MTVAVEIMVHDDRAHRTSIHCFQTFTTNNGFNPRTHTHTHTHTRTCARTRSRMMTHINQCCLFNDCFTLSGFAQLGIHIVVIRAVGHCAVGFCTVGRLVLFLNCRFF